jgi:hypothetical protein
VIGVIKGKVYKISRELIKATTPPTLSGIERRIEYANKKYHSGWMCSGVFIGSARMKFSGSLNKSGKNIEIANKITVYQPIPRRSL